jgi:polar amino acid transport system substrate-binding protein
MADPLAGPPPLNRRGLLAGLAGAMLLPARLAAAPLEQVKAAGALRIAVYRDFEPWSWAVGGVFTGIDVALGQALAGELGVKAAIVDFLADDDVAGDLRNIVWRGSLVGGQLCDVMMHVPTDRRFTVEQERCVIGAAYAREGFAIACGPGADCEAQPPQWAGRRLVAELDSIPDIYLSGGFGGVLRPSVVHRYSGAEAVAAVVKGEADVVVASRAQIEHALAGNAAPQVKQRHGPIPALPSAGWDVGLACKDNSRDLADALEAAMERLDRAGRIDAIFAGFGVNRQRPLGGV